MFNQEQPSTQGTAINDTVSSEKIGLEFDELPAAGCSVLHQGSSLLDSTVAFFTYERIAIRKADSG